MSPPAFLRSKAAVAEAMMKSRCKQLGMGSHVRMASVPESPAEVTDPKLLPVVRLKRINVAREKENLALRVVKEPRWSAAVTGPRRRSNRGRNGLVRVQRTEATGIPNSKLPESLKARRRCAPSTPRPSQCTTCGKVLSSSGALRTHRLTHASKLPFACFMCPKSYTTIHNLTAHVRTHTGERPFVCDLCGKRFNLKNNMQTHRRIHTGELVGRCEHCGTGFTDVSFYMRHMRSHLGIKQHKCSECAARFVTKIELVRHLRTHTGQLAFSCGYCEKRYRTQSACSQHVIRYHTHKFPFRCTLCDKGFTVRNVFDKHERWCKSKKQRAG